MALTRWQKLHIESLKAEAIKLRWERSLYSSLARGIIANRNLAIIEKELIYRTGKAY